MMVDKPFRLRISNKPRTLRLAQVTMDTLQRRTVNLKTPNNDIDELQMMILRWMKKNSGSNSVNLLLVVRIDFE